VLVVKPNHIIVALWIFQGEKITFFIPHHERIDGRTRLYSRTSLIQPSVSQQTSINQCCQTNPKLGQITKAMITSDPF